MATRTIRYIALYPLSGTDLALHIRHAFTISYKLSINNVGSALTHAHALTHTLAMVGIGTYAERI